MSDSLLLAFGIGLAFGWTLERAGLGRATKVVGQFTRTDFVVFKVMFSAIVTAMLGVFWLSRFGLVDRAAIYVPTTYLMPQALGGLIFGAGFVVAGLCPGTSCVSAASGRGDGATVVAGMLVGMLAGGALLPFINSFYGSTNRGVWQLPALLHLSYGGVVLLVVLAALAGFGIVERLERA